MRKYDPAVMVKTEDVNAKALSDTLKARIRELEVILHSQREQDLQLQQEILSCLNEEPPELPPVPTKWTFEVERSPDGKIKRVIAKAS